MISHQGANQNGSLFVHQIGAMNNKPSGSKGKISITMGGVVLPSAKTPQKKATVDITLKRSHLESQNYTPC